MCSSPGCCYHFPFCSRYTSIHQPLHHPSRRQSCIPGYRPDEIWHASRVNQIKHKTWVPVVFVIRTCRALCRPRCTALRRNLWEATSPQQQLHKAGLQKVARGRRQGHMGCLMLAPMELSDSSLLRQPLKVRIIFHCSAAPSVLGRKLCTKFPRPPATASRMFACMLRPECHPFPTPSSARSAPLRSLPMLTAAPWQLPCRRESSRTHPRIPPIFEDLPGSENWCRPCHFIGFGCGQCKPFAPAIPLTPPRDCTHQPAHPAPPPAAQASRQGGTGESEHVGLCSLASSLAS